jgi:hypothetical protein
LDAISARMNTGTSVGVVDCIADSSSATDKTLI